MTVVLICVHRAAEDEHGAVGVERLRQGRFPGEAPLVEVVPAFLDDVAEDARTDSVAVDDRQHVHCGHSTLKSVGASGEAPTKSVGASASSAGARL